MDIAVIGRNRASTAPERATVHLTIACEADNPDTALQTTTVAVNEIHDGIRRLRHDPERPTTWSAVLPIVTRSWRPWNTDGTVNPLRHSAAAKVKVKFRDFAALALFIQEHGVNQFVKIENVEWALTRGTRNRLREQVLAAAVNDAVYRATVMAHAAGLTAVTIIEVADPGLLGGASAGPGPHAGATMRGAIGSAAPGGGPVDLVPEDVEIAAEVHARFTAA